MISIWSEAQQRWMEVHGITLDRLTYRYEAARIELRDRLNARLRGKDPGAPINWRGLNS